MEIILKHSSPQKKNECFERRLNFVGSGTHSCMLRKSALCPFANVRICRLVASFGVSHQRIFHIECYIRLHLGPALLTFQEADSVWIVFPFFLQGQHWQVYSFVPTEQKRWTPLCYSYQYVMPISHVTIADCVLLFTSRQESHFSHQKLPRFRRFDVWNG